MEFFAKTGFNEIPHQKMEYKLTTKGQEMEMSIFDLLQWMIKWS
jgi:DNA-binding HxlR family transcriptional regulator